MESPENINAALFDILDGRTFEQLTPKEKEMVLEHVNEETFNEMSQTVVDFVALDNEIEVASETYPILTSEDNEQPWYKISIPFYQAAAAVVILLTTMIYVLVNDKQVVDPVLPEVQTAETEVIIPNNSRLASSEVSESVVVEAIAQIENTITFSEEKESRGNSSDNLYPDEFVIQF